MYHCLTITPFNPSQPPKLDSSHPTPNYYLLLSLPQNASYAEIKSAYHKALLQTHPDKQNRRIVLSTTEPIDISALKEAYVTLSSPELRARYDASLMAQGKNAGPRPAQVVSLEEFTSEVDGDDQDGPWRYDCRCGGIYRISVEDMERGLHLIGCTSCSEIIWAGYELQEYDSP
ncbi:hypothetical protein BDQ17DRAFT_1387623 [Cyathus striatus]|nr:hypothetical protein BDQ17DRAFT_1387623 [Cyathus striatus]